MIYSRYTDEFIGNYEYLYAKISANLIHFFGNSSLTIHKQIVNEYLKYKNQSILTLNNADTLLKGENIDISIINKLKNSPIIYSYCIGEYRLLPIFLLFCGFSITILMKGRILKKYSSYYYELLRKIQNTYSINTNVSFVSSDEQGSIIKLRNAISNGSKIIIYLDGNSGTTNNTKNTFKTRFLSQEILFHQGVSYLSYIFNVQPIGVTIFKNGNKLDIELLQSNNNSEQDKNTFINNQTKTQLLNLENLLTKNNISIWDSLESIHSWIDKNNMNLDNFIKGENRFFNENNTKYNIFRYAPFHFNNEYYLLDKKEYLTYKISKNCYEQYSDIAKIYI